MACTEAGAGEGFRDNTEGVAKHDNKREEVTQSLSSTRWGSPDHTEVGKGAGTTLTGFAQEDDPLEAANMEDQQQKQANQND